MTQQYLVTMTPFDMRKGPKPTDGERSKYSTSFPTTAEHIAVIACDMAAQHHPRNGGFEVLILRLDDGGNIDYTKFDMFFITAHAYVALHGVLSWLNSVGVATTSNERRN